jgi:hypothetical protein
MGCEDGFAPQGLQAAGAGGHKVSNFVHTLGVISALFLSAGSALSLILNEGFNLFFANSLI